jgi:hypothetical protein
MCLTNTILSTGIKYELWFLHWLIIVAYDVFAQ